MGCFKKYRNNESGKSISIDYCEDCLDKQLKIDRLEEENRQLKAQLRYRTKKDNQEFPFGSSTPSSQKVLKSNSTEEKQKNQGGAKEGHVGNGRQSFSEEEADEIVELPIEIDKCPHCGSRNIEEKGIDFRSIIDTVLMEARNYLFKSQVKRCKDCRVTIKNTPDVLPRNKYGNNLITDAIIMHYLEGIPLKRIEQIFKITEGNLIKIFHRLAQFWAPAIQQIKKEYRESEVKHADETGWRTNGDSGYCWLFIADEISIFDFQNTRAGTVPQEILGLEKIPGVLVVDRYAGYNKSPCKIQYCYAHLLRDLQDLEKKFPKKEVNAFVSGLAPLLAKAMGLRRGKISDEDYYLQAKELKESILLYVRAPAKTIAIQKYQDIWKYNEQRLFHWVENRKVPADNNRAERELRPTVIARKVSFGSQSTKGSKTRSVMMSILHTAAKRLTDQSLQQWFRNSLIELSRNPGVDPCLLLPAIPGNPKI